MEQMVFQLRIALPLYTSLTFWANKSRIWHTIKPFNHSIEGLYGIIVIYPLFFILVIHSYDYFSLGSTLQVTLINYPPHSHPLPEQTWNKS